MVPGRGAWSIATVLTACALLAAGCGDDDRADTAVGQSTPATTVTVATVPISDDTGPVSQPLRESGGKTVSRCAAIDTNKVVGHIDETGFYDIVTRGLECREAHDRVLKTGAAYTGENFAAEVGGYACKVISVEGGNATVRCTKGDEASYRFGVHTKPVPAVSCGEFGRFYDISAFAVPCSRVEKLVDAVDWSSGTTKAGSYRCSRLYAEGGHSTVRCVDGNRSFRLTIDTRTAPKAPKAIAPPKTAGVCPHYKGWRAITVRNISCEVVMYDLDEHRQELLDAGMGGTVTLDSNFACRRLDSSEAELPTVRCKNDDATYRASYDDGAERSSTSAADSADPDADPAADPADDGAGALDGAATTP